MIKDSGNRREFETGAVRDIDEAKGRCDLLPLSVFGDSNFGYDELLDIAVYQENGYRSSLYHCFKVFAERAFNCVPNAVLELSIHFKEGAEKYGEYNWQKGIPTHSCIDSAVRHYLKYMRGDTDERHDRAFLWNIACCIWTCENKPELNDYAEEEHEN